MERGEWEESRAEKGGYRGRVGAEVGGRERRRQPEAEAEAA